MLSVCTVPRQPGPGEWFAEMEFKFELQDIPEEKQNDFKQAGDRYRKMSMRE